MISVELFINNIFFKNYSLESIDPTDIDIKSRPIKIKNIPDNVDIQLSIKKTDYNFELKKLNFKIEIKHLYYSSLYFFTCQMFKEESEKHTIYEVAKYCDAVFYSYFQAFYDNKFIYIKDNELYLKQDPTAPSFNKEKINLIDI